MPRPPPLDPPLGRFPGARLLANPLERLYLLGLAHDRRRQARTPPHRLAVPVISVGNLSVGGTGKTPVVEWLARAWLRRGGSPGILSRGYRGGTEGNDEFRLLERRLPGVPHVAERKRSVGGERLLTENPSVDLIILDDGFQHRRVHRDLDLVLIDATRPFGGGRCLPAGWLREPWGDLQRADAILITRGDQVSSGSLRQLERFLGERFPASWLGISRRVVEGVRGRTDRASSEGVAGSDAISPTIELEKNERVGAFCAIGNPAAFFSTLPELGVELVWTRSFRDHHRYRDEDLAQVRSAARSAGVQTLLTTEKDGVKLEELPSFARGEPQIAQVRMRTEFPADELLELALEASRTP